MLFKLQRGDLTAGTRYLYRAGNIAAWASRPTASIARSGHGLVQVLEAGDTHIRFGGRAGQRDACNGVNPPQPAPTRPILTSMRPAQQCRPIVLANLHRPDRQGCTWSSCGREHSAKRPMMNARR